MKFQSLFGSSKSNKAVNGTFNVRAKVKTVLGIGFILAVSLFKAKLTLCRRFLTDGHSAIQRTSPPRCAALAPLRFWRGWG